MPNYVDMFLFILHALGASNLRGTLCISKSLPWPHADEVIQAVCPYSNVCDVKPAIKGPGDSCCSECFCGDECVDGRVCCLHNNTKKSYETCLYLRSKSNNYFTFTMKDMSAISYYVVTKTPDDGCQGNNGGCNSTELSALYPVFSAETDRIYFDKDCAICHGIEQFKEPDVYFICDETIDSELVNFDEELSKFLAGDESSACYLSFYFNFFDVDERTCSIPMEVTIDALINISNEDQLRNNYNMTIEDLKDACLSGLNSPTLSPAKKSYPNPFCYLYGEGTHKKGSCFQTSVGTKFSAILNPNVQDVLRLDTRRKIPMLDKACYKSTTSSTIKEHGACRPVTCPLGRLFDKNSRCTFFGLKVYKDSRMNVFVNIVLKKKLDNPIHDRALMNITIDELERSLELPDEWKLTLWGWSVDSTLDSLEDQTAILIILEIRPGNLPDAVESMELYLNSEVVILNNSYTLKLYGKTLPLVKILPVDILSDIKCSTIRNRSEIPKTRSDVPDCWKVMAYNRVYHGYSMTIEPLSKLYFCNLVQLNSDEFRLLANETVLFNKVAGVYLYENEFLVQKHKETETFVKVCTDDSGLIKPVARASCTSFGTNTFVYISVFIFFSL